MPVGRRWFKRCPVGNSMWLVFKGLSDVKNPVLTCFHHIAAPCQGIFSILEVFFCLIAPTLFKKIQYITFVLWFQVSSTRFFGLQTQDWLWINRSEAWPGWLQKSTSAPAQGWRQGEVMMTEGGSRSVGRLCHVCSSSLSQQAVSLETLWMFWIQWAPSCTGTCPSQCKCSTASSGRCLVVSASFHSSATMTGRGFTGSAILCVFWRYSPRLGWSWWQRRGRVWRILFLVWFSSAGAADSA